MKATIPQAFKLSTVQNNSQNNNRKILDAFSALLHRKRQQESNNKVSDSLKSFSLLDMVSPYKKENQNKAIQEENLQITLNFRVKLQCGDIQQSKNTKSKGKDKAKVAIKSKQKLQSLQGSQDQYQKQESKHMKQYYVQSQQLYNQQEAYQCKFVVRLHQETDDDIEYLKQTKQAKKSTKHITKNSLHKESKRQKVAQARLKNSKISKPQEDQQSYQQLFFKIKLKQYTFEQQGLVFSPQNSPVPTTITVQPVQPQHSPLAYQSSNTEESPQVQIINVSKAYPWRTGKASLKQLVQEIYNRKLINQNLYKQFNQNHSFDDIKQYLQKFYSGRLHKFNFDRIKFTILDHRRFSQLLINLFPGEYQIGKVSHMDDKTSTFLNKLYQMTGEEYYKLYAKIDKISKIKWWSKILICQEDKLKENNKEKRLAQRKAEKAQLAVQQVLNEFRSKLPSPFGSNYNQQNSLDVQDMETIDIQRGKRIKFN